MDADFVSFGIGTESSAADGAREDGGKRNKGDEVRAEANGMARFAMRPPGTPVRERDARRRRARKGGVGRCDTPEEDRGKGRQQAGGRNGSEPQSPALVTDEHRRNRHCGDGNRPKKSPDIRRPPTGI